MFDQGALAIDVAAIDRTRQALERYCAQVRDLVRASDGAVPSAVYELSTSASPEFAQRVLDDRALEQVKVPSVATCVAKLVVRETLKMLVLSATGLLWRMRHGRVAMRSLRESTAVQVGFVAIREGRAVAHDFHGFTETVLRDQRVAVLGRRLPQESMRTYLGYCRPPVVAIEAYLRWSDLWSGLTAAIRLRRRVASLSATRGTVVEQHVNADIVSGHMMSGWMMARAVIRLVTRHTAPETPVCLPMERHDWETLVTQSLSDRNRAVWAVQNCTFSPLDLNMYAAVGGAPRYRSAVPQRLFVVSQSWGTIFAELGMRAPPTILEQHRFSAQRLPLRLAPGVRRILYIGSINAQKVIRDLQALRTLRGSVEVEIRLHPSCANLPAAADFTRQPGLDGTYGACVFADTTMVFQLETDRSRLVFLDHPGFPNQNPAAFFASWPGKTVVWGDQQSAASELARLLE